MTFQITANTNSPAFKATINTSAIEKKYPKFAKGVEKVIERRKAQLDELLGDGKFSLGIKFFNQTSSGVTSQNMIVLINDLSGECADGTAFMPGNSVKAGEKMINSMIVARTEAKMNKGRVGQSYLYPEYNPDRKDI